MKKGLTEIVFIMDNSGSMGGLESDTIGGYNAFIEKQKKVEGEAFISTVLFNDRTKVIHDRVPLEKVTPMTEKEYRAGGCTALLDAVGGSIHHIANIYKYARKEDVPEKTIFVITTDGLENSSTSYSYEDVKKMISKEQEKYGWEFIFLGANIDVTAEAEKIGIRAERAARYNYSKRGTKRNFDVLSCAVMSFREEKMLSDDWKAEIEEHADDDEE